MIFLRARAVLAVAILISILSLPTRADEQECKTPFNYADHVNCFTFKGNIDLSGIPDVEMPNLMRVDGTVTANGGENPVSTSLELPNLMSVTGALDIWNNNLTTLDFSKLESVSGGLLIADNNLTTLVMTFSKLKNVSGGLRITNNNLATPDFTLKYIRKESILLGVTYRVEMYDVTMLFSKLKSVSGDLLITGMDSLMRVFMPHLDTANNIQISGKSMTLVEMPRFFKYIDNSKVVFDTIHGRCEWSKDAFNEILKDGGMRMLEQTLGKYGYRCGGKSSSLSKKEMKKSQRWLLHKFKHLARASCLFGVQVMGTCPALSKIEFECPTTCNNAKNYRMFSCDAPCSTAQQAAVAFSASLFLATITNL